MSKALILNVDDNVPARYARTRVLQVAGFDVVEAGCGEEAFKLLDSHSPHLVLLDVHLPDINGIEVCRRIKAQKQYSSTPVLQLSATATSAPQATAALNSGADSYLTEPVDPDVLVASIRALLRIRSAEHRLAEANAEMLRANRKLQQLNRALRRSNDDLEHFAYIASHDLKEPLRTITTHLQLIDRALGDKIGEHERDLFEFVVSASRRMSLLIDDVLTYSRLGQQASPPELVDLSEVVSWTLGNLNESIEYAKATIRVDALPQVLGDPVRLGQVFQNLIGNALKYCSPDRPPEISISATSATSGVWEVSVRDNGIGIAEEHQASVFNPFKRLHGQEIPGTGIGLAVCRRIIEAQGGEIWLESEQGKGTTFTFTLPARAETAMPGAAGA